MNRYTIILNSEQISFTTRVQIPDYGFRITREDAILSMGSCFADHIGNKLERYQFATLNNPFGIVFNPISIGTIINRCLEEIPFQSEDLFIQNGMYHSFETHSMLSHKSEEKLKASLNSALKMTKKRLQEASLLLITLGSSWGYRLKSSGEMVANCHKVDGKKFDKVLISHQESESVLSEVFQKLLKINPKLQIMVSVSPVRHWKDGALNNSLSKSHLRIALSNLCEQSPRIQYFPSFEIFMDELRDYRFYKRDLVHPSDLAIDYVFGRFEEKMIDETDILKNRRIEKLQQFLAHRPFNAEDPNYLNKKLKVEAELLSFRGDQVDY